jgi:hypothetical protein
MTLPGFTVEISLYAGAAHYRAAMAHIPGIFAFGRRSISREA